MAASKGDLNLAISALKSCIYQDRTIFVCGNGGSAEQANHFVAELVGRYKKDRPPYRAVSLCGNIALITAVANDFGYDQIFSRQLEAMAKPFDVLVVLSTSGNSLNIYSAVNWAYENDVVVISMTGPMGIWSNHPDAVIQLKSPLEGTNIIQEQHLRWIHELCEEIERGDNG